MARSPIPRSLLRRSSLDDDMDGPRMEVADRASGPHKRCYDADKQTHASLVMPRISDDTNGNLASQVVVIAVLSHKNG